MDSVNIADKIKELRISKGLTQSKVAKDLNIKQQTLSHLENEKTVFTDEYIKLFASYYQVSADYLLGLTEVKTNHKGIQYIGDYIGLSDKAIYTLHSILLQSKGVRIEDRYAQKIQLLTENLEKIQDTINSFGILTSEDAINKNHREAFSAFCDKETIELGIDIYSNANQYRGKIILDVINNLMEKENTSEFWESLYIYLYAKISADGEITAGLINTDDNNCNEEIPLDISKELLLNSYLLKINEQLKQWQTKDRAEIVDIESYNTNCYTYNYEVSDNGNHTKA